MDEHMRSARPEVPERSARPEVPEVCNLRKLAMKEAEKVCKYRDLALEAEASGDAGPATQAKVLKYERLAMEASASPILQLYFKKKHFKKKLRRCNSWESMRESAAISETPEELEQEEPVEEERQEDCAAQEVEARDAGAMGCCGELWSRIISRRQSRGRGEGQSWLARAWRRLRRRRTEGL